MISWGDLEYLSAVIRAGSLAGAARELKCEHSTVARRISALENALGAKLFTRGPEGLIKTKACEEIVPLLTTIASNVDALERRVHQKDERVEGVVRLTVTDQQSSYFIDRLRPLLERHPGLTVSMLNTNRVQNLLRGEADVAVRMAHVDEQDLIARKVVAVGWTLYAAPSYLTRKGPFTPLDFTGHEIILFDAFPWPGGAWLAERSQGATVAMRATTMPAVQDACAAGLGIAMLPCYAADPDTRIERLVPNICGSNDMKIVTHKDLVNVARVRTVIDYLVEIIERDRALWTG